MEKLKDALTAASYLAGVSEYLSRKYEDNIELSGPISEISDLALELKSKILDLVELIQMEVD